ncbi:Crp/Fnr family transcriptional regulator (plasmid) [Vibrio sp. SS-MA-C1-2]|uniref:Crp/Fnr family transcriptional regulator n=1 Tax=Vibrio sp. SS-MA-C1-2 TaxID=2908646 RepID=UPI001F2503CE|nr:Crp/Fnr family transcriptional regulator [Vibrio sp. SS-MA-C1-2]UJF20283.1 Crp/Fnr family transcriptional regulator [Vibrio sp. SS-MA-C1-2]
MVIDEKFIDTFKKYGKTISIPERKNIITPDMKNCGVFLILRGSCKVWLSGPENKPLTLSYLNKGSFIGELAFLNPHHQSRHHVTAMSDCILVLMGEFQLNELIKKEPMLLWEISQQVAVKLRKTSLHAKILALDNVASQLYVLLQELSLGDDCKPHTAGVLVPTSRKKLSEILSCSFDAVSRGMTSLESQGFISRRGNKTLLYHRDE